MANGAIKGITIKLGADASELSTALSKADKSLQNTQKQLNEVSKALKFNPGNVDLLRQKEELLTRKVNDTNASLKNMKEALKMMDAQGIERTSDEYMKLEREIVQAESKQKAFNKELKEVQFQNSTLGQLSTKFSEVGSKIESVGQKMAGLSIVAGATATAIGALAVKSGQTADDLNTLSKVYGISTQDLQLYSASADLVDVSVSAIAKSQVRLKKNMLSARDGAGQASEAFEALGISVTNADGSLRNQDEVFQELLKKLGSMSNETERDAYAMAILGKSASELNPLIEDMGETYAMVSEMFKDSGIDIVDQKTLDKANQFNDSLDKIKTSFQQAFFVAGAKLASTLAPILEKLATALQKVAGWIAGLNPKVLTIIGVIAGVLAVLAPLLIGIGKVAFAISSIMAILPLITGALSVLLSPITLIIAGVTALAIGLVVLYNKSETFRNIVNALWDAIKNLATTIANFAINAVNSLRNAFSNISSIGKNIVTGLWNGISDKFSWLVSQLKSFATNVKNKLKSFFGIKSPSKWARDMIGKNIDLGMAKGIVDNSGVVEGAMASLVPNMNVMANADFGFNYNGMYGAMQRAFADADFKIVLNDRVLGRGLREMGVSFNG